MFNSIICFSCLLGLTSFCARNTAEGKKRLFILLLFCSSHLFLESSASGSGSEACLTVEALDALGFLITGSIDRRWVSIL